MSVVLFLIKSILKLVLVPVAIILFILSITIDIVSSMAGIVAVLYNMVMVLWLIVILVSGNSSLWTGLGVFFGLEVLVTGLLLLGQAIIGSVSKVTLEFLAS